VEKKYYTLHLIVLVVAPVLISPVLLPFAVEAVVG